MNNLVTNTTAIEEVSGIKVEQCTNEDYKPKFGTTNSYTWCAEDDAGGLFKMWMSEDNGTNDAILSLEDTLFVKFVVENGRIEAYVSHDCKNWMVHPPNIKLIDVDPQMMRYVTVLNPIYKIFFKQKYLSG